MNINATIFQRIYLYFILIFCFILYYNGLNGPFIFDDNANLKSLADNGGIDTIIEFWRFITSNNSGPLGRPLSMLSFTLNAQDWPAEPFYFKLTNLLIHCLNGFLVYLILKKFTSHLPQKQTRRSWLTLLTVAIWLLHPLHVSTVLYVVQRMTLLSSTFILIGILSYSLIITSDSLSLKQKYKKITITLILFGLLAIFSKENGVLLPLFAFISSATLLNHSNITKDKYWTFWNIIFTLCPYFILIVYFFLSSSIEMAYERRDFTISERLLTQSRIFFLYLKQILLPNLSSMGLYHEELAISRSILQPISTLFSVASLIVLVGFSFARNGLSIIYRFALYWFICGHLLESTIFPLELYFEHRNYIASIGPIFFAVYGITLIGDISENLKKLNYILLVYLGLLIFLTFIRVDRWSSKAKLSITWAEQHPTSVRTQQEASNFWLSANSPDKALKHISIGLKHNPSSMSARIGTLYTQCFIHNQAFDNSYLVRNLSKLKYDIGVSSTVRKIAHLSYKNKCHGVAPQFVLEMLDQLLINPTVNTSSKIVEDFKLLRIETQLNMKQCKQAIQELNSTEFEYFAAYSLFLAEANFLCKNHDEFLKNREQLKDMLSKNEQIMGKNLMLRIEELLSHTKDHSRP